MAIEAWLLDKLLEVEKQVDFLTRRSNETMATLQDVQEKIAAEKAQVAAAVESLKTEIQALKDQIGSDVIVTPEQLDALADAVDGIFAPEVPAEEPVEPAVEDQEVPAEPVV